MTFKCIFWRWPLSNTSLEPGIDRALIARIVEAFYIKVRKDPVLGPIFEARIRDWPAHLNLLERFWASVILRSGEYKGAPHAVHVAIPGLNEFHFERWLDIFGDTLEALCTAEQALAFRQRASRIARSLLAARLVQQH
jgi:hemoglobin